MADWSDRHEPRRKYDFRLVIHSTRPSVARQLVVPQGFTLSATGVFAILLERRPHPGPIAIWLFVAGAAVGFSVVVRASRAHRPASFSPVPGDRSTAGFRAREGESVPVLIQGHGRIKRNKIGYSG